MHRSRRTADSRYQRQSANNGKEEKNGFNVFNCRGTRQENTGKGSYSGRGCKGCHCFYKSKKEEKINSFVTIDEEGALKKAAEVQAKIDAGELKGALAGVPVAIKDNMCTEGLLTTCSSKILYNFIPTYTAEAVKRLEDAGCVIVGKTNMDEFAMGSTTETSAFGATKNPWNTEHVPGGSSGGSCAAVAAEEVPFALGSDTGGSIRQPSSFCGVTGIKPTYGTVSRYGLIAYGSSLDQIGPIAKDVTDCAAILEAIASYDTKDSTSVNRDDLKFTEALVDDVKGMKIGIPKVISEMDLTRR